MNKNVLNLETLSQLEQNQYPIGETILKIGKQSFVVKYKKKFKDSEIQGLVKEWMEIKEATTKAEIELNMYDISFILILKHFTDVPFENHEDILQKVDHYIRMTNLLLDLRGNEDVSLFEQIFKELDKEEILKVTKAMGKMSQVINQGIQELESSEEYQKLLNSLREEE